MSLISFSRQYRKAVKTNLETVYIFRIYLRISQLIPVTRYPVKEKFMSDIKRMTKIVTSFRCQKTSLFRRFELHIIFYIIHQKNRQKIINPAQRYPKIIIRLMIDDRFCDLNYFCIRPIEPFLHFS